MSPSILQIVENVIMYVPQEHIVITVLVLPVTMEAT